MPESAVYVGRGSKWGNPYRVGERFWTPRGWTDSASNEDVVTAYREDLAFGDCNLPDLAEVQAELAGKDLACWCPLDKPCHADVLLEAANA